MSWLAPAALLWLGSLPVLVWLWRLATSRRQRVVPSLVPFEPLLRRRASQRQRVVVNRLFWLQAAALGALALALAQPAVLSSPQRTTLVLLDTSASMAARGRGPSAFERARRQLGARLARKPPGEQWLVVTTAPVDVPTRQTTADGARLRRLLETLSPRDLSGSLGTAAQLGQAVLGRAPDQTLVVTDEEVPAGWAGQFLGVGRPLPNAAIVGLDAQGPLCGATPAQVVATLENFGPQAQTAELLLEGDGRRLREERVELPAGGRRSVTLAVEAPGIEWLRLRLRVPGDALAADDTAQVPLSSAAAVPVLISSEDGAFQRTMSRWLGACEGLSWSLLTPTASARPHVLVTDRADAAAPAAVGVLQWRRAAPDAPVTLAHWLVAGSHPVGAYLDALGPVAAALGHDAAAGGVPVVWAVRAGERVPVVTAVEAEGRRHISLVADPVASPSSTPLLLVFFNSLRWLARGEAAATTGEPLLASLPPGEVLVRRPDGAQARALHEGGVFRYEETDRAGRYELRAGGAALARAVNFADPLESDLQRRVSTWRPPPPAAAHAMPPRRTTRPLAPWLIAAVLACLLVEWRLYCRRRA
jgi:hypothetical protein